jgi:hypothetical protein
MRILFTKSAGEPGRVVVRDEGRPLGDHLLPGIELNVVPHCLVRALVEKTLGFSNGFFGGFLPDAKREAMPSSAGRGMRKAHAGVDSLGDPGEHDGPRGLGSGERLELVSRRPEATLRRGRGPAARHHQ